jgi:uncharacterized alkaline shock family protein YloU
MRVFTSLGILFYATILSLIGLALIVFSLYLIQPQDMASFLSYMQSSLNLRWIIGLAGGLLIFISFSFANLILGIFEREKTIAFTTSAGEVTIALSAVEDLIRQLAHVIPEIKELRPNVIATKKGISVDLKVVLKSEANLPELTARLQDITKSKIQDVLGVEEEIIIKIHITKIVSREEKERKRKEIEKTEPTIPFGGYGRV